MSAPQDVLLLTSPPFAPSLWDKVRERLQDAGLRVHTPPLVVPAEGIARLDSAAEHLAQHIRALGRPVALVAHSGAIPVALRAAASAPPAALILSNGPLSQPDPVLRVLGRLPQPLLAHALLRPRLWLRALASSAGLRRAVINPYVMDHDMVVAVCGPLVQTAEDRAAIAAFFKDLAAERPLPPPYAGPVLLPWGDSDLLYPAAEVDQFRQLLPRVRHVSIPGGRHLHPIEQPWAIADILRDWLRDGCTTT